MFRRQCQNRQIVGPHRYFRRTPPQYADEIRLFQRFPPNVQPSRQQLRMPAVTFVGEKPLIRPRPSRHPVDLARDPIEFLQILVSQRSLQPRQRVSFSNQYHPIRRVQIQKMHVGRQFHRRNDGKVERLRKESAEFPTVITHFKSRQRRLLDKLRQHPADDVSHFRHGTGNPKHRRAFRRIKVVGLLQKLSRFQNRPQMLLNRVKVVRCG